MSTPTDTQVEVPKTTAHRAPDGTTTIVRETITTNPEQGGEFKPRFRVNRKQKAAGGDLYFEGTIEMYGDDRFEIRPKDDQGDVKYQTIGARLEKMVADAESEAVANGRKLVAYPNHLSSDEESP